jgi:hypothetical protein
LEFLLKKIDPRFCTLWQGAHLAAASSNPDRVRHACVSIRELFTHVLHFLAPDEQICKWTSDPCRFHNGRPTRKSRFLYLFRPATSGALSDYLFAEITSLVALANVLQEGTHGIGVHLSPLELKLIFDRIEGALCTLIEMGTA